MTSEKLIKAILNKCSVFYDDALISKEDIIKRYLSFITESLVSNDRAVNLALHTGSICFDIISVVAVSLWCLSYNLSTNDDIISALNDDDMVMYKGQRFRWKGIKHAYGNLYIVIEQDGKGKNGKTTSYIPFEKNKHLIKPYYGDSKVTDGRGIRNKPTNREDFLAFIFESEVIDIPTQLDVSVVVVANRVEFNEICKKVKIGYAGNKFVGLLDIFPASYYTSAGEQYPIGSNPSKTDPVLKVTEKISTARDLVLDKHGNRVVGLLIMNNANADNTSDLSDLLRRKALRFVHVTSPIQLGVDERVFEMYEDAAIFACTKEFLSRQPQDVCSQNPYTKELHRQITNIVNNRITPHIIAGGWAWDEYKLLKDSILKIKQSDLLDSGKEDFIVTAYSLMNLMNTAVFPMVVMERAIIEGAVNQTVASPKKRIEELWSIAARADILQDDFAMVVDTLERKYQEIFFESPKGDMLNTYITSHREECIAVIVPKAYYVDVLRFEHPEYFMSDNRFFTTGSHLNVSYTYDAILCVGQINSKKFDPLQCMAARSVDIFLYRCEEKLYLYRKNIQAKYESELNHRSGLADVSYPDTMTSDSENDVIRSDVQRFATLDEYIDSIRFFDVRKITQGNASSGAMPVSEVTHVGMFETGEQIFFSKYYSAVVFDDMHEGIIEKSPDKLVPGDVLVFAKRDDYTKNIVDYIYEMLLRTGRLGNDAIDAYEKSKYWKEVLREYKESHRFTYRDITHRIHEVGGSMQEVSVRQWLVEDSHIVGPQKESTMEYIAKITQDPFLLADVHGYFEACNAVRHDRRSILELISKAINDKLSGNVPAEGSALCIVYDNVDRLSETLVLESVVELDESIDVSVNLVNTPITEAEVST